MAEIFSTNVNGMLTPSEVWQQVAESGKQYALLGESDHRQWQIGAAVVAGLPVLAAGGFKHMGLEWSRKTLQPVIDDFNAVGAAARQTGADVRALNTMFEIFPSAAACANPALALRFRQVNASLVYFARNKGLKLHALDQLPTFGEHISAEPPARQERFMRALVQQMAQSPQPSPLLPDEQALFVRYLRSYELVNLTSDKGRAASLQALGSFERTICYYGSAHFRGDRQGGIDAHLPAHEQVYVLLGNQQTLAETLANPHRRSPDYVIDVATNRGWAL